MIYLVTGTAGFIGFHLARRLLEDGHTVVGFDGLTPYYDVRLKLARLARLEGYARFQGHVGQLEDMEALRRATAGHRPDAIVHLAAQAGVRYSIENPRAYADSNLVGSFNILELARDLQPRHLLLASTSSAYGANEAMPFRESDRAEHPLTFYAATKKAMESLSHAYAHLFRVPTTCFRFFTVYGPWGRPDMALFRFVDAIEAGRPIDVYGGGEMLRDFTYIDDLVEAIVRLCARPPIQGEPATNGDALDTLSPVAPWRLVNIGGGQPVGLLAFIETIERCLGKPAIRNMLPMQPGDVPATFADHQLLEMLTGYRPATSVETGVTAFVDWFLREAPAALAAVRPLDAAPAAARRPDLAPLGVAEVAA